MENQEMYYTYFKPVVSKEHMLYAKEIAEKYSIYTSTGKLATTFVSQFLQNLCRTMPNYEQLYYVTRSGPAKVYPKCIYDPMVLGLTMRTKVNEITEVKVNNKKYKIMILEEN